MPNVTRTMAEWAASVNYEDLPAEVVTEAKRFLMDSVGCALGGAQQHDVHIAREVLGECAGSGDATVLITGEKWDPVSASLLNALMIRVMDYNDIYWKQDPSHPSDIIPAAMAAAERAGRSGRDLLVGIALAYEFEQRLCEVSFPGVREIGWHHATLTAAASPIAAGRMLGLTAEQIQHAIGISASRHCTTGSVTAGKLTMMKNTVDPMATQSGVIAALLAEKGYTGPEHVLDGKEGFSHVFSTEWKFNILTDGLGESWRILQCGMKFFPTEALTHAPISATLDLVNGHDLAAGRDRDGHHLLAGAGGRHPRRPLQVRSPHQGDRRSLPALCHRRSGGRPAGDAAPVHRRQDHGLEDPRPTAARSRSSPTPRSKRSSPSSSGCGW